MVLGSGEFEVCADFFRGGGMYQDAVLEVVVFV